MDSEWLVPGSNGLRACCPGPAAPATTKPHTRLRQGWMLVATSFPGVGQPSWLSAFLLGGQQARMPVATLLVFGREFSFWEILVLKVCSG